MSESAAKPRRIRQRNFCTECGRPIPLTQLCCSECQGKPKQKEDVFF